MKNKKIIEDLSSQKELSESEDLIEIKYRKRIRYYKNMSFILALIVIILSCSILIGWIFNIPLLRGEIGTFFGSKFNTALILMIGGFSLLFANIKSSKFPFKYLSIILSVFVIFTGIITLYQYLSGLNLGLDQLLYTQPYKDPVETVVGRTKFLSSIVLIFNGLALLFLNLKNKEFLFQTLALTAGFLAFFGFTGNIYGARIFQGGDWYVQMALLSSIVHIVLSIAIIFNRPDKGWMSIITSPQSGGIITRLLLGNLLIIIFALGLLRIIGEYIGLFGGRTGTVIIVVSTSVILLILILLSANKLNIIDEKREIAVKKIKRLEQFYENIIESINEGIFVTDNNDKVVYYNDSFKKITGMDKFDVMGTDILKEIPKENVEGFLKNYLEAKDTLKPVYYESIPLMTPDSKKFFTGWIIPQVNGEFKGALCTIIDDTERKNASDLIENSLKEKEMLLGEIHHRVKNNLQIISSLLNLQSMHIKDPQDKDLFTESQNRVKSMAIIHEKLYQSQNFTKINLKDYTNSLVKDIMGTYMIDPDQIKIDINAENIELNLETAIPSGLIINELITNSIKHAFPEGQEGKIDVYFEKKDNKYILKIADNGVGFPPNLDLENAQTLGLELVNNLIKQLDGSIELVTNHGTSFKITFPEMEYKKRI